MTDDRDAERRDPDAEAQDAHDVLAAEAFEMGAGDPALHDPEAHDVLAAEEFEVGAGDPRLRGEPVTLPDDPSGIAEPHDVLAAEEFAMPVGRELAKRPGVTRRRGGAWLAGGALIGAVAVLLRRRR